MKTRILVTASMVVALAAPAHAQLRDGRENPLTAARDLYASARYDEALAVLNGLPSDAVASDRKSIEQYRSLCLLALGRGTEAESAIAAVVTADPLFMPGEADASPRVRAAFSEVRQRLLPQIATDALRRGEGRLRSQRLLVGRDAVQEPRCAARRSADGRTLARFADAGQRVSSISAAAALRRRPSRRKPKRHRAGARTGTRRRAQESRTSGRRKKPG